jgi:hypothetical protein
MTSAVMRLLDVETDNETILGGKEIRRLILLEKIDSH